MQANFPRDGWVIVQLLCLTLNMISLCFAAGKIMLFLAFLVLLGKHLKKKKAIQDLGNNFSVDTLTWTTGHA